ncbi:hypothetical protein ACIPYS_29295 [Kitasatospora sp. NPDC089913]|uniref:hypothetical protein n=1 Tax=Streptomycetaceae TaxID=2062 RepID=UPI00087D3683|nr:hypothetical protein [Streptomyces sp. TLI_053]SDT82863.1 hypothetical protein SAMN05216371_7670 [Streptomyces sp. TLI_053]
MRRLRVAAAVAAVAVLATAAVGPGTPPRPGGPAAGDEPAAAGGSGLLGDSGLFGGFDAFGASDDFGGYGAVGGPPGQGGPGGFPRPGGFGTGRLRTLAGVLRQDRPGSGWYLVGGAHLALNLEVAYADHQQIVLRFPAARRVVSVLCGPDETYAPLGYSCGASVSLDEVRVRLGRNGRPADPTATAAGQYANFWLLGLVEQR